MCLNPLLPPHPPPLPLSDVVGAVQRGPSTPEPYSKSSVLPVLPALQQVGVFAQHSFQLPPAPLLLLDVHAAALHRPPAASGSSRAAQGARAGAVGAAPTPGLPGRGVAAFVGMRTAGGLFHAGDGGREKSRGRDGAEPAATVYGTRISAEHVVNKALSVVGVHHRPAG